jgi:hypothetical protein
MGRPKKRKQDEPRFELGDRVVWKSGKNWKSGEVLFRSRDKAEVLKSIPKGYKLQYSDHETKQSKTKSLTYLVAADSPLFKPGFSVHSIPERHLQKESESWIWKSNILQSQKLDTTEITNFLLTVGHCLHKNKKAVPSQIKEEFETIFERLKNDKI